jgi:hypothetical protein
VVRRFVGYERCTGLVAGQYLAPLYQAGRLYVNHFQPSFKPRAKTREGAKVKKSYHPPATPCERLLEHGAVPPAARERLRAEGAGLDPLELLHQIREAQAALAAFASRDLGHGPWRDSLEQFLAKLPELWRQGEARPTHRQEPAQPRTWRTRQDPFEGVWPEILAWLQAEPQATARSLFERPQQAYPGRFPAGQLRTLQRRVREWRCVMARDLVYGCLGAKRGASEPLVLGAEGQVDPGQGAEQPGPDKGE